MRRDDPSLNSDNATTGYTFHFQISNGGSRKACSVRVQAPSHRDHRDAAEFVRHNWPTIEAMARENMARCPGGDRMVEIDMP
jgi:hypothetical protein